MTTTGAAREDGDPRNETAVGTWSEEAEPTLASPTPQRTSHQEDIEGETFHTVFGNLLGIYTWECDRVPSVDEVHAAMEHRVRTDCATLRLRSKRTRLAGWHGGWTPEGVGIFAADIWSDPRKGPARHLGRLSLVVHTPLGTGLCLSRGIAC
ncbi:MAG TPA: hypothetical protein VHZ02_11730 [Acidimicrobiales bacterium]|nr:hypothetical protein [Acidimicrobiales bacterium]